LITPRKNVGGTSQAASSCSLRRSNRGSIAGTPSIGSCPLEGIDTKCLAPDQVSPDSRSSHALRLRQIGCLGRQPHGEPDSTSSRYTYNALGGHWFHMTTRLSASCTVSLS